MGNDSLQAEAAIKLLFQKGVLVEDHHSLARFAHRDQHPVFVEGFGQVVESTVSDRHNRRVYSAVCGHDDDWWWHSPVRDGCQQLKAIQRELGDTDENTVELDELRDVIGRPPRDPLPERAVAYSSEQ